MDVPVVECKVVACTEPWVQASLLKEKKEGKGEPGEQA